MRREAIDALWNPMQLGEKLLKDHLTHPRPTKAQWAVVLKSVSCWNTVTNQESVVRKCT